MCRKIFIGGLAKDTTYGECSFSEVEKSTFFFSFPLRSEKLFSFFFFLEKKEI